MTSTIETDKNLKWIRSRNKMIAVLIFSTIVFLAAFGWTIADGLHIATVKMQHLDAVNNIAIETTLGHLWFEEILEGDSNESIDVVWDHLVHAQEYVQALLEGGEVHDIHIIPLLGSERKQELQELDSHLCEFIEVANLRYANIEIAGVGSEVDQKFDGVFRSLMVSVGKVEHEVKTTIAVKVSTFRLVSGFGICGSFLLILICGTWLKRYEWERVADYNKILSAEKKLLATNEELNCLNEEMTATNEELNASNEELEAQYEEIAASNQEILDTQELLRKSEERFELALSVANDGMWDWDMSTDTTFFDARYFTMAGYEPYEFPATFEGFLERVHPDEKQPTLCAVEAHRNGKTPMYLNEFRFKHKNGDWLWIRAKGQIVARNENGDPLRMVGTHSDITEQKHAAMELRELNKKLNHSYEEITSSNEELEAQYEEIAATNEELTQSNNELDDFAYIASHDLKEPLRGISNYSTFLVEDYSDVLDEEGLRMLETLPRLTKRLEQLIDDLLRFSRVGRVDLAIGDVDLEKVVDEVLDSVRIVLDEQSIEIRRPRQLPNVRCDRIRIREVFLNLITNSFKYNDKAEKWIELGFLNDYPGTKGFVFFVRDNGIGIPEKHIEKIFTMFKRLHARDKFGGGTGAGMTIVKKIVERHKGRIWVESEVGAGTVFFFTLGGS